MRVFGYCRVSTDRQAEEGESLTAQERTLQGYCAFKSLPDPVIFIERGVSGSIALQDRPEGSKLWAGLQAGDIIVLPKLDRGFRDAYNALGTVKHCEENGIQLHILDLGGDIINNGISKAMFTMVACFAELQRDGLRDNIRTVKQDQKSRGKYLGGSIPFGWTVLADSGDLVPVPEEQEALTVARQLRAKRVSLRKISEELKTRGHKVSHVTLGNILDAKTS